MRRGRPPAKTDAAALAARAEVREFLEKKGLNGAKLARMSGVAPATVTRVLERDPPTWTGGFKVIVDFVKSQKTENAEISELAKALRGNKNATHAAATLLRAVATLLERS